MKKLLVYLKKYRLECVLSPAFKLFEAFLELLVPLIMARIIDNGILQNDKNCIIRLCLLLVVLGVAGLLFAITAQFFAAKASVGFAKEIRHALFEKINTLSFRQLDMTGENSLITRLTSDVDNIQNGVNLTLRLLLRSPYIVFGCAVMALIVDFKVATVFLAVTLLLFAVVFSIMLYTLPLYKKSRAKLDRLLSLSRENLTGIRVIRAFVKEDEETENFRNENNSLTKLQEFTGKISVLLNPLTYVIINIGIVFLIYFGARRVNVGAITQGQVVALYNYMAQIIVELVKLANLIITVTKSFACAERVQAVLETEGDDNKTEDATGTGIGAVDFRNVSFSYNDGGEKALKNISFTANMNETVGIIGSTGSGKTTLANLIPGYYTASDGDIFIFGRNVKSIDRNELRKKVSVVAQKSVLFKGTLRENLLWGREDADESELLHALEIAQAKDFILERDDGLDCRVEQGGKNFSGGQRQRLSIARSVISKPDILILDDSTSALDFLTDAALRKAVRDEMTDCVTFIIAQRTSSLKGCDKIIVLENGEAVGIGTHDVLMKNCETYREIHLSQFDGEDENG